MRTTRHHLCIHMTNKDKTNSNSSTRKGIRFDNELLKAIDKERGKKPLGTWVQEVCAQHFKPVHTATKEPVRTISNKKANRLSNSYATEHDLPSNITRELHEKIIELSNQGLSSRKIAEIILVSKATVNRTIKITIENTQK